MRKLTGYKTSTEKNKLVGGLKTVEVTKYNPEKINKVSFGQKKNGSQIKIFGLQRT